MSVGMTSLASQAAVTLINNQGDIGKTLDQLGQEKSVQNLVTAMVTAGALDKLGKSDWLTFDGHKLSEIGLQPGQVQDFSANLFKNAVNATSSAAVSAMVSGKPFDENSLADALGSALVTTSTAFGAKGIGDAKDSGDLNTFTHKLAHAVLGCAGGAATQGSMDGCSPGAVGAVVGELAAEYYNPSGNPAKAAETVNFAKLMSALAGVIATGDGSNAQAVNTAAAMGANAAENNYLSHPQILAKQVALDMCNSAADVGACKSGVQKAYTQLSKQQTQTLENCADTASCRSALSAIAQDYVVMQDRRQELEKLSYQGKITPAQSQELLELNLNIDSAFGGGATLSATAEQTWRKLREITPYAEWTDAEKAKTFADAMMTVGGLGATMAVGGLQIKSGGANQSAKSGAELAGTADQVFPGVTKGIYNPKESVFGQGTVDSCAASCTKMAAVPDIPESYIRDAIGTQAKQGTNLADIPAGLQDLGFQGKASYTPNATVDTIAKQTASGGAAIVNVRTPGGDVHAIIVDSISNGVAYIRDPLPMRGSVGSGGSAYSIPASALQKQMTGKAVYITPPPQL